MAWQQPCSFLPCAQSSECSPRPLLYRQWRVSGDCSSLPLAVIGCPCSVLFCGLVLLGCLAVALTCQARHWNSSSVLLVQALPEAATMGGNKEKKRKTRAEWACDESFRFAFAQFPFSMPCFYEAFLRDLCHRASAHINRQSQCFYTTIIDSTEKYFQQHKQVRQADPLFTSKMCFTLGTHTQYTTQGDTPAGPQGCTNPRRIALGPSSLVLWFWFPLLLPRPGQSYLGLNSLSRFFAPAIL